jgi:cation diffusion facilitator CzcD-associated flavoprotein CzcO
VRSFMPQESPAPSIAIIGAGFSGLGMAYYLKKAGLDSFTIFEKSAGLGGVWRENTYPGAACDVPSHLYSFSFDPHYPWSTAYGPQREILDYLQQLARKYQLVEHIRFGREVAGADFDDARGLWQIRFTDGAVIEAQILITGVGQLHRPALPAVPGIERFKGRAFHSAQWDHAYDLTGKTVASIGTGPSAIQYVPAIAPQVKKLQVFQRSPAWCVHKVDRVYTRPERWLLNHWPWTHTLDRLRIFWYVEFVASVIQKNSIFHWFSNHLVKLIHWILLRKDVPDPALRAKLTPDFPVGCKRLLFSNEWFKTLVLPQVELVTEPITAIDETGVVTADGRHRAVDAIIYGTGFTATQFLAPMDIRGRAGASLRERWKTGAQAYLGVAVAGFPNFFMLYGPNTNLGVGTIIYMLERQQRYVVKCLELLRARGLRTLEVQPAAEGDYNAELDRRSHELVYLGGCNSWYLTNGRNTQNWVGYMTEYGRRLREPQLAHYALDPA